MQVDLARAARYGRAGRRWALLLLPQRTRPGLRVFYGHDRIPGPGERVAGGTAKFQRLQARFPNCPADFTLLYLGSTWLPRDLRPLLWLARRRGMPVVLNQNGVGYPAWAGEGAEAFNRPLRLALDAADHVLYQSEFCKRSADALVGPAAGSWEILHNAVDVESFKPAPPREGPPVLLLGGDQTQAPYRLELGLRTLSALLPRHPSAKLVVTGRLLGPAEPLIAALGLEGRVEVVGPYSQREAPALFGRAHVLLHTQAYDSCPSLVLEAMACGLPVVYPASGGVVELVGGAGIGVPHPGSWDRIDPPAPEALAEAAARVLEDLPRYRAEARRRAVERFGLSGWLDRHAELFDDLLRQRADARARW